MTGFMAALQLQPVLAEAACREVWHSRSSTLGSCSKFGFPSGASSSCPFTAVLSSISASCKQSQAGLPSELFEQVEVLPCFIDRQYEPHGEHKQCSNGDLARPFWLGLILQWTFGFETRRAFITGSLHRLSNRLAPPRLPFVPKKLTIASQPTIAARRAALMIPFAVAASTPWCGFALNSTEEETFNLGRSFLQKLGIGDQDIFYPRFFEGTWICKSTLVAVDTPQGEEKADSQSIKFSRKQLGYTVTYRARFIPFQKYVIGDRLFTTQSLVESTVGTNIVDHGVWTPERPDRLTLVLRGGLKVQNVVTKRSSSLSGPGQFDTSEYSQQIFDNNRIEGGPPKIKASQNQTRYRWDPANKMVSEVEAFQRVSMYPVVQDSLSNVDIMNLDKPITVYKYIVRFTRDSS